MRIRQLEYFVEICRTGSITRAATNLNVAQPALGMQIRSLEEEFGTKLLKRTPRGTVTTLAGDIFREEAEAIINRVRFMKQRLNELKKAEVNTLKLGLTPSLANLMTGRLLEAIDAARLPVAVQIFEEFSHILIARLERGELDMALAYSVPEGCRLPHESILHEELKLIFAPGSEFDCDGPLEFHDLVKVPFVMPSERDYLRRTINEVLRRENLSLNIIYQVESMPAMKDLILRRKACGILPFGNVVREMEAGSLRARSIVNPSLTRTLYQIWPTGMALGKKEQLVSSVIQSLLPALFGEVTTFSPTTKS